jgi:hypothetical protein
MVGINRLYRWMNRFGVDATPSGQAQPLSDFPTAGRDIRPASPHRTLLRRDRGPGAAASGRHARPTQHWSSRLMPARSGIAGA